MSDICVALKKDAKRCTHKAKWGEGDFRYCGTHKSLIKKHHVDETSAENLVKKEDVDEIPVKMLVKKKNVDQTSIDWPVKKENVEEMSIKKKHIEEMLFKVSVKEEHIENELLNLKAILFDILNKIVANPISFINLSPPSELCKKLNTSASKKQGQGRANGITTQEASFAFVLETNGFSYLTKKVKPITKGMYYVYQPNGSQRCPDFNISCWDNHSHKIWSIDIDMKQSNTDKIVLNDGWFNTNTIYVLSYKINNITIGLGQDIPSVQEQTEWERIAKIKKELNNGDKIVDSLHIYFRFANQYKCDKFTQQIQKQYLSALEMYLNL